MPYYLIAPAKTFHQSDDLLTYSSSAPLKKGHIVSIPLGRQHSVGIVISATKKPPFATKDVEKLLYKTPLPPQLLRALSWLKDYYRCPLSSVIQAILPRGIAKSRRPIKKLTLSEAAPKNRSASPIPLSPAQRRALKAINDSSRNTVLLHGITGSGKTNIYLRLAEQILDKQQSLILLVPEIALTSQLVDNFSSRFDKLYLLHSAQSESLRHQIWEKILDDPDPKIVIGPRSALFAPVDKLGLIIIDEAHEPGYYQDQNPKYFAPRLAAIMGRTLLGTATPLVSDYFLCKKHQAVVPLNELAIKTPVRATTSLIDFKDRASFTKSPIISNPLIESINTSLQNHTESLIFHNRRGTASLTICDQCGWQSLCPTCFLPLVLHHDLFEMHCHSCGRRFPVPTSCPNCHDPSIHHKGFGTKQIENELSRLFPRARIARFDADNLTGAKLQDLYTSVRAGDFDIIVGTQMIAKGFDFPKLTTLGIVQADAGLSLPDFSSEERVFELITQVIGRAKRGHQNSKIFIQSYQPDHPIIHFASSANYSDFYNYLIQSRRRAKLPPFTFLLKLSLTYKTEVTTIKNIQILYKKVIQLAPDILVSPPMPAFYERNPQGFTWQILLKSPSRKKLLDLFDALPKSPKLRFQFDPPSLL